MRKTKKPVLIVAAVVLVLVAVFLCLFFFVWNKAEKMEDGFERSAYSYTITRKKNSDIVLSVEKGEYSDGTWSCTLADPEIASFTEKKGKTDRFTFTPEKFGTTDVVLTLNDGKKDVYKLTLFYVCLENETYLSAKSACVVLDDKQIYGDSATLGITFSADDPDYLKGNILNSADKDFSILYDSESLKAYYITGEDGNKELRIFAFSSDFEETVTVRSDEYDLAIQISVDENYSIVPLSAQVSKREPVTE